MKKVVMTLSILMICVSAATAAVIDGERNLLSGSDHREGCRKDSSGGSTAPTGWLIWQS